MPTIPAPAITQRTNAIRLTLPASFGVDHRVREVMPDGSLGNEVRYFGLSRTKGGTSPLLVCDVPILNAARIVIEAVDRPGPFPPGNFMDRLGRPVYPNAPTNEDTRPWHCTGPTMDGLVSANGQGDPMGVPVVVATSAPFDVVPGNNILDKQGRKC